MFMPRETNLAAAVKGICKGDIVVLFLPLSFYAKKKVVKNEQPKYLSIYHRPQQRNQFSSDTDKTNNHITFPNTFDRAAKFDLFET